MLTHVLVKFVADFSDEFDVHGLNVFTLEEWKEFTTDAANKFPSDWEWYFGTNEWLNFSNIQDYLRNFKVTEISESEANSLQKLIGLPFGHFPDYRLPIR